MSVNHVAGYTKAAKAHDAQHIVLVSLAFGSCTLLTVCSLQGTLGRCLSKASSMALDISQTVALWLGRLT